MNRGRASKLVFGVALAAVSLVVFYPEGSADSSGAGNSPIAAAPVETAGALRSPRSPGVRGHCPSARRGLVWYRAASARWYRQMGARRLSVAAKSSRPCRIIRYEAKRERLRARVARLNFEGWYRQTYERWRCVHEREGAWNDPHAPYWGGVQMDMSYQRAYGREFLRRWGTADRWPIWAQLVAAERGRRERGWQPWPNTARECGLL